MYRLLLVDDEPHVVAALARLLRHSLGQRIQIDTHTRPAEALLRAQATLYDAVMSDYRMPEMDGVSLLAEIAQLQPDAARIVLSAVTDFDMLTAAINRAGIDRFLPKPWDDDVLITTLDGALRLGRERRDARLLAERQRYQQGQLSAEALERQHLEQQEPGITRVRWGSDGEVLLDDGDAEN